MTTFGKRLRWARTAKGVTQDAVAEALGIKRVNVTKWEADDYMPGTRRIAPLAEYLGISEDWLLSGKGEAPPVTGPSKIVEAEALLRQLSPEELERELTYLRSLVER